MKIPQHFVNHSLEYIVVFIIGGMGLGALAILDARQDARHLLRVEAEAMERARQIEKYDEQIQMTIDDDARLRAYNLYGSEANKPARDEIMTQNAAKRARLQDKKDTFIAEKPE